MSDASAAPRRLSRGLLIVGCVAGVWALNVGVNARANRGRVAAAAVADSLRFADLSLRLVGLRRSPNDVALAAFVVDSLANDSRWKYRSLDGASAPERAVAAQIADDGPRATATLRAALVALMDSIPGLRAYRFTYGAMGVPKTRAFSSTVLTPGLHQRFEHVATLATAARRLGALDETLQDAIQVTWHFEDTLRTFGRWTAGMRDAEWEAAQARYTNQMASCVAAQVRRDGTGGSCAVRPTKSIEGHLEYARRRFFRYSPLAAPR